MSAKWQRITIRLPEEYNPIERQAIGLEIVDHIRERTLSGKDKNNNGWSGRAGIYSSAYKKFKSSLGLGTSTVDIRLSGDTLAAMQVLSDAKGKIIVGFENGTEENAKADGNIRGTYGQRSPIPGKKRDFLGITAGALDRILSRYPITNRQEAKERAQLITSLDSSKSLDSSNDLELDIENDPNTKRLRLRAR